MLFRSPLEDFIPTQVIKDKAAFEKLHAEAKKRVQDYKNPAVSVDQKSISYYQALRDIGEGKGRSDERSAAEACVAGVHLTEIGTRKV